MTGLLLSCGICFAEPRPNRCLWESSTRSRGGHCPALSGSSPCTGSWMGSAPFPLFPRVILTPVISGAYSGPTTPFNLSHRIKITNRAERSQNCSGVSNFWPVNAIALPIASASPRVKSVRGRCNRHFAFGLYYYSPKMAERSFRNVRKTRKHLKFETLSDGG